MCLWQSTICHSQNHKITANINDNFALSMIVENHFSAVLSAWRSIKVLQTLSCDICSCQLKKLFHKNDLIITAAIHEGLKQKFNKQRNDIEYHDLRVNTEKTIVMRFTHNKTWARDSTEFLFVHRSKFETNLEGKQKAETLKKYPDFMCDSCHLELPPISEKAGADFNIRGSPSKHLLVLKTSSRHVFKICPQDVFKTLTGDVLLGISASKKF